MMKWFKTAHTIEEVKRTYRALCKQYHHDIHGAATENIMKEINAEYERAFNRYKNIHESAESGKTYEKETNETPEQYREIIETLIKYSGLTIDLCGTWIWVTGNTYPYKDIIKGLGFRWASKHKKWYYHNPEDACNRHSGLTYEQIKEKYGCDIFKGESALRLAAQA